MGVAWRYTPPAVNAVPRVAAAAEAAVEAAAQHVLDVSQPLVPVDTGALRDSGKVTPDGMSAHVSYEGIAEDGYDYGQRQHEDMQLHHPNGGQPKFLEQPLTSEADAIAEALAVELRKALLP